MRKLATLLLAAGMVLGSFAGAQAIDFKAKGEWIFEFAYTSGINFATNTRTTGNQNRATRAGNTNGADNFEAIQRVRLQLDAVASESLSGQVFFEIGNQTWGRANQGGALGTDGIVVEVRRAFIDWIVPNTDLRVRMGLQGMALPSYTFDSGVFNDDVAGITASYKFNDNVSLVAFWARPYNDNFAGSDVVGQRSSAGFMDNTDAFGLVLPLKFDGFKITPWGMLSFIGPNTLTGLTRGDDYNTRDGLMPSYWRTGKTNPHGWVTAADLAGVTAKRNTEYATAWWAGITGEITAADPLRIAWDANYGSVSYMDTTYLNRAGWFVNLLIEYKLDWGVPGIYGWWGSGDDSNPKNGSERMPVFSVNNSNLGMSTFGFNGGYFSGVSDTSPLSHVGTWGIGLRIRDMSFLENLTHTVRVNFFGGTNDPINAKYITGKKATGTDFRARGGYQTDFNSVLNSGTYMRDYLTTMDYGLEVNVDSVYKIYENLDMLVELGYIHLWLDQSRGVWGPGWVNGVVGGNTVRGVSVTDAVKASVFFRYSF